MASPPEVSLDKISFPEIIFGLVAPIGVDLDLVTRELEKALSQVKYTSSQIKLTQDMRELEVPVQLEEDDMFSYYDSRIRYANAIRATSNRDDALALLAIASIRRERGSISGSVDEPVEKRAYIVRQLKRIEEIELLKNVYGKQYITVSIYQSEADRIDNLTKQHRSNKFKQYNRSEADDVAKSLVDRDYSEQRVRHGQRMRDAFPAGDVFINASNSAELRETVNRFIMALFGDNRISPNTEEYGMYLAKTASFRSLDLSRQVGAAILSCNGEVVTLGSNEVPKAYGGTYWSPDDRARDIFQGFDPNEMEKTRILEDIVNKIKEKGGFSERVSNLSAEQILIKMLNRDDEMYIGDARVLDILEFGRIIHAEMSAITDAARLGRAIKDAVLYCTTFPCHICAKHIVASGIKRVVFLEPYPKSHAVALHEDSITLDGPEEEKVWFKPFIGISPQRFRDIFEKTRSRKDDLGKSRDWYEGEPKPRISINTTSPSYS